MRCYAHAAASKSIHPGRFLMLQNMHKAIINVILFQGVLKYRICEIMETTVAGGAATGRASSLCNCSGIMMPWIHLRQTAGCMVILGYKRRYGAGPPEVFSVRSHEDAMLAAPSQDARAAMQRLRCQGQQPQCQSNPYLPSPAKTFQAVSKH